MRGLGGRVEIVALLRFSDGVGRVCCVSRARMLFSDVLVICGRPLVWRLE